MKGIISSENAPKAIGPFSQAVLHDNKYTMELSGQIGIDPATGKLTEGIEKQTGQILENISAVLSEAGWNFGNLVKVRIFLTDMADYGIVNEIYSKKFSKDFPARVAVAVKELPLSALIEIDCQAAGNEINQ